MNKVVIHIVSPAPHVCQILAGYEDLFGEQVIVEDHLSDPYYEGHRGAFLIISYQGLRLVYDMNDGYNDPETILWYLEQCDFYFKRSYSSSQNALLFPNFSPRIFPTGLWYQVSPRNNPFHYSFRERFLDILGIKAYPWFTQDKFERAPVYKKEGLRILYSTRLWEPVLDNEALNQERREINSMRINLVRSLARIYKKDYWGGLYDTPLARKMAPDLILPKIKTIKNRYLAVMHSSDICIGSMGLHKSIGGKTGEYVAASKAIVNETLHYEVTGDFTEGRNYISFRSIEECLDAVNSLYSSPESVYEMKVANSQYYNNYLKPATLVHNTLDRISQR